MSKDKTNYADQLIVAVTNILEKYDSLSDKKDLKNFIVSELINSEAYQSEDEAQKTFTEIDTTIDLVTDNLISLRKYKEEGKTATIWLREKINQAIEKIPDSEKSEIIKETKKALKDANNELFSLLYDTKAPEELSEPIKNYEFKDINATSIVQNLQKDIKNNTILGAITISEGFKLDINLQHKEVKAVKEFIESKLDSQEDRQIKKVVTTAVEIAKKKGFEPLANKSTTEVALMVDKGLTAAKLAYKVGKGEFSPVDVADYMIDRTASAVSAAVTKTCQTVGSTAGKVIGGVIGSVFGPAGAAVGSVVGKAVGYVAGTGVGMVISKGINAVANVAKEAAKAVWEGVKSVGSAVMKGLKKIASFFGF